MPSRTQLNPLDATDDVKELFADRNAVSVEVDSEGHIADELVEAFAGLASANPDANVVMLDGAALDVGVGGVLSLQVRAGTGK